MATQTLATIAADPKHLGAQIGATLVLHTWGSALTHHPHVHGIVPGGGLSLDGQRWVAYLGSKRSETVRVAPKIVLTPEQQAELTKLSRSGCTSVRLEQRARIVLLVSVRPSLLDCAESISTLQ